MQLPQDLESGQAAPAGRTSASRTDRSQISISHDNKTVLEAAAKTQPLLARLRLPYETVRGGGVQFVGKLGDIAVAALRVLLMPLGQAVRSVGNGPAPLPLIRTQTPLIQ